MGAKQTVQYSDEALKTFNKEYTLEKTIDDARFGKAQVYKNNNGSNKVIVTSRVFATKAELQAFTKSIQARLENFSHPNLLSVLGYQEFAKKNLCSQMNKFNLYFEYLRRDLASEIKARSENKEHFSEEEAWYLVNSIFNTVQYLHSRNFAHGAVHPSNVLVNGEGEIKLYDNQLLAGQSVLNRATRFQAPEELAALENEGNLEDIDKSLVDLYAIGLTLLQILTLRDVSTHVYEDNKINNQGIAELVFQAKRNYSPALVDLTLRLLSEKPENRIALQSAQTLRQTAVVRPAAASQFYRQISVPQVAQQAAVEQPAVEQPVEQVEVEGKKTE